MYGFDSELVQMQNETSLCQRDFYYQRPLFKNTEFTDKYTTAHGKHPYYTNNIFTFKQRDADKTKFFLQYTEVLDGNLSLPFALAFQTVISGCLVTVPVLTL